MPLGEIIQLNADLGLLFLRLAVAAIFIGHSWGKLTHPGNLAKAMKWSPVSVMVLGLFELLSALLLIVGELEKLAALVLSIVMIGALYNHVMRWGTPFLGSKKQKGFELEVLLLAATLALLLIGGGHLGFINSFLAG